MKNIKFRCWYDNRMHKVVNIDFAYEKINLFAADIINFKDGKLMQYIGLHDKNGKEIYEGDIVELKSENGCCTMLGKIIYDNYDLAFELIDEEGNQEGLWYAEQELEVIGNIYENKELLEEN